MSCAIWWVPECVAPCRDKLYESFIRLLYHDQWCLIRIRSRKRKARTMVLGPIAVLGVAIVSYSIFLKAAIQIARVLPSFNDGTANKPTIKLFGKDICC